MSYISKIYEALGGSSEIQEPVWEQIKVLVVDDESMVAQMYRDWLEDAGFQVEVANGGEEALRQIDEEVDVVILDRRMPMLSGDEVLEAIRSQDVKKLDPEKFEDRDPYHITEEYEDKDVKDISLETVKKLDPVIVDNLRNHELDPQICMLTAVDPDFDIIDMEFDHYVVKNVDRNHLVELVGKLAALGELQSRVQKYQSTQWKKILLGRTMPRPKLEKDEDYQELENQLRRIEEEAGEKVQKISRVE